MSQVAVRGFVLGSRPFRETDRIVSLFTLSQGKLRALAKGSRSPKSRTASSLELLTEGDYSLHKGRGGDLFVLGQTRSLDGQGGLKKDLAGITALQVIADLLEASVPDAEPHPELYQAVKELLAALKKGPGAEEALLTAFALRLVELLGHPLELGVCASCGRSLKGRPAVLIPHRGGALCGECYPSAPERQKIGAAGRETLRMLLELPLDRVHVVRSRPQASLALFRAAMGYLEATLERELRSVKYYLEIREGMERKHPGP